MLIVNCNFNFMDLIKVMPDEQDINFNPQKDIEHLIE